MAKEFVSEDICTMKVGVYLNRDGNILQQGEIVAGEKNFTFKGFASDITEDDAINTENSPALHNGVCALMWLFSGYDEGNFDENFTKISTEVMEDV